MDNWQVAQNYIVAAAIAGTVGGYYYYTSNQTKRNRTGASPAPRRSDVDLKSSRWAAREKELVPVQRQDNVKKSKAKQTVAAAQETQPAMKDEKPAKESDMSNAQFAQQLLQARQGADLSTSKAKETRVKTVKPKLSAAGSPAASVAGAEVEDDVVHASSSGDVSDMLEAKPAGPTTLRITASERPQTRRAPRQHKEQAAETKKQRQNRKKVEERKAQREEDETERKVLEERQRRAAREARGEPAKNGLAAKPPTSNPWEQRNANDIAAVQAAVPVINGPALLDTFDAESTSSSTGGLEASTAATSTTSEHRADALTEEQQMAAAIQRSGDESGWTVAAPKKAKKQPSNSHIAPRKEARLTNNANGTQAKTGSYAALETADDTGDWEA